MRTIAACALALASCTAENGDAPDERCSFIPPAAVPYNGELGAVDADGHPVMYRTDDGAQLFLWPSTRYPSTYRRIEAGHVVEEWGCWLGGELAYECEAGACMCYETGQSWDCIGPPGTFYGAVLDAEDLHGPYVPVTR